MSPAVKNALMFIGIGCVMILAYLYIFNKKEEPALVSSAPTQTQNDVTSSMGEFLPLLLSVRNIQLDDSIFTDPTFMSLRDSSIELVPDGTEGRPNPFAPIGVDIFASPPVTVTPANSPSVNTPKSSSTTTPSTTTSTSTPGGASGQ